MENAADGRAVSATRTFRLEYGVGIAIAAPPDRVWSILTDANAFPRWNSTVSSIEGPIALGQRLSLRVPLAPQRTFRPRVSEFTPPSRMVWGDGMAPFFRGRRTFTLAPRADGGTHFSMIEVFSGLMLPMIKRSLPDFAPAFEQYARDLKREAEGRDP
jgi:uncharacterized protein YndB with AHSA1/START domain